MDESGVRGQLEQHHAESYGWALSCCAHNPVEAEDVLQMVYMKILQGRARYDGRSALKTWLFAVIRHTAANERRRHWLRRLRLERYAREQQMSPPSDGQDHTLGQPERLKAFQAALARLSARQQEVLHLTFYQDLTLQEAAGVMGVTVGSARTHYERGKARLRGWLNLQEQADE